MWRFVERPRDLVRVLSPSGSSLGDNTTQIEGVNPRLSVKLFVVADLRAVGVLRWFLRDILQQIGSVGGHQRVTREHIDLRTVVVDFWRVFGCPN